MPELRDRNAPEVAKEELRLFLRMTEMSGMDDDSRRRSLRLSHSDWQRWLGILEDAPLPSEPRLPLMLRHLGYVNNRLERAVRGESVYA